MEQFEKLLAAKQKEIEDLVFQAEDEVSYTFLFTLSLEKSFSHLLLIIFRFYGF